MLRRPCISFFFFFNDTATTEIYTLSLHDALPISRAELAILRLECLQEMEDFGLRQFGECEVVARRVTRDASATGRRTISINRRGRGGQAWCFGADARVIIVEHVHTAVPLVASP